MYRRERIVRDYFFFFQAEDGIRDIGVTGVQTCALPIWLLLGVVEQVGAHYRADERAPPRALGGVVGSVDDVEVGRRGVRVALGDRGHRPVVGGRGGRDHQIPETPIPAVPSAGSPAQIGRESCRGRG